MAFFSRNGFILLINFLLVFFFGSNLMGFYKNKFIFLYLCVSVFAFILLLLSFGYYLSRKEEIDALELKEMGIINDKVYKKIISLKSEMSYFQKFLHSYNIITGSEKKFVLRNCDENVDNFLSNLLISKKISSDQLELYKKEWKECKTILGNKCFEFIDNQNLFK